MNDAIARSEVQLGAIMRRVRRQKGLTQAALGERMAVRQGTVSRLEAGQPAIQLRIVMAALAALDLELVVRPRTRGSIDLKELF